MNIGEKIKSFRTLHQMTQEQLSTLSGISLPSIRKYEAGERNPKPDQLLKLSEALGISINIFMDFEIRTVSDLLSLIFKMDEQVQMHIEAQKDNSGNYIPETVKFSFAYDSINQKLCTYLSSCDKREELKVQGLDTEHTGALNNIDQNISDLVNLLLDDDTRLQNESAPNSASISKEHTASGIPESVEHPFIINRALQDLFLDCTPHEAELLLENAKLLKEYIRKL